MNRLSLVFLLLAACSCSHAPVSSAAHDLEVISQSYNDTRAAELIYDALPPCMISVEKSKWNSKCSDPVLVDVIRTAGFNAEASLTIAEGERTDEAVNIARNEVVIYKGTIPRE